MDPYPETVDEEDLWTHNYAAPAGQNQYSLMDAGVTLSRQDFPSEIEEFFRSADPFSQPPGDLHEGFDWRDDASRSFESNIILEDVLMGSDTQYRNENENKEARPLGRGTNWGSWSQPQPIAPMDPSAYTAPFGTQFQNQDQFPLETRETVLHDRDLTRDDQDMFARASDDVSQTFTNDIGAYVPGDFSGGVSFDEGELEQPSYTHPYSQGYSGQNRNNPHSISSHAGLVDVHTNPNTLQHLHQTTHATRAAIPSISFSGDGPWSSETLRGQDDHNLYLRRTMDVLGQRTTRSVAATTDVYSGNDASSMFDNDPGPSTSSLDSTGYEMMDSQATIQPFGSPFSDWQWPSERFIHNVPDPPDLTSHIAVDTSPASHLNAGDESIPGGHGSSQPPMSALAIHVNRSKSDYLAVPLPVDQRSEQLSEGSGTSGPVPEVLECERCHAEFRGTYRKGNKARHMRLKHSGDTATVYVCQACPNERVFNRQDARLKHYRKHHPDLNVEPARPRRASYISQPSDSSRANSMA